MPAAEGDIYLVTFNGTIHGQRTILTHHYALTTLGLAATDTAVREAILDAVKDGGPFEIEDKLGACLSSDWSCQSIWCQKVFPTRLRRGEEAGIEVGDLPPVEITQLTAAVTLVTDKAGRDQQSTKKIGPIPTTVDYVSNGILTPAMVTLLDAVGAAMSANLSILDDTIIMKPCIFHGPPPFDPIYDVLTDWRVGREARILGRRGVGKGV